MINLKFVFINNFKSIVNVRNHIHSCYELIYYFDAEGYSDYYEQERPNYQSQQNIYYLEDNFNPLNRKTFEYKNNSYIIFPPNVIHNEIHYKTANVIAIGFELEKDSKFNLDTQFHLDTELTISNLVRLIAKEYMKKDEFFDTMVEALISEIIIHVSRLNEHKLQSTNPMLFAKSYIKEYFATEINLKELAEMSGYSLEHFRLLFKKYTGLSPKSYILEKRLTLAKKLLTKTSLALTSISSMCGFEDYAQFSTFFKKKTKLNPKQYRKQHGDPKRLIENKN